MHFLSCEKNSHNKMWTKRRREHSMFISRLLLRHVGLVSAPKHIRQECLAECNVQFEFVRFDRCFETTRFNHLYTKRVLTRLKCCCGWKLNFGWFFIPRKFMQIHFPFFAFEYKLQHPSTDNFASAPIIETRKNCERKFSCAVLFDEFYSIKQ